VKCVVLLAHAASQFIVQVSRLAELCGVKSNGLQLHSLRLCGITKKTGYHTPVCNGDGLKRRRAWANIDETFHLPVMSYCVKLTDNILSTLYDCIAFVCLCVLTFEMSDFDGYHC